MFESNHVLNMVRAPPTMEAMSLEVNFGVEEDPGDYCHPARAWTATTHLHTLMQGRAHNCSRNKLRVPTLTSRGRVGKTNSVEIND